MNLGILAQQQQQQEGAVPQLTKDQKRRLTKDAIKEELVRARESIIQHAGADVNETVRRATRNINSAISNLDICTRGGQAAAQLILGGINPPNGGHEEWVREIYWWNWLTLLKTDWPKKKAAQNLRPRVLIVTERLHDNTRDLKSREGVAHVEHQHGTIQQASGPHPDCRATVSARTNPTSHHSAPPCSSRNGREIPQGMKPWPAVRVSNSVPIPLSPS